MNILPKQIAIIGSTASGKSALAVKIAHQFNAVILSLDSLAIYKDIDIVSAKPTLEEREGIKHFGIDILTPDVHFDVTLYIKLYQSTYDYLKEHKKNLIIVGGSSFYLKMLLDGISTLPLISTEVAQLIKESLKDSDLTYKMLQNLDPIYMQSIKPNDSYRIEKALTLYHASGMIPSLYFANNPPQSIIKAPLPIYEITTPRAIIRERINQRTQKMFNTGLIDEIATLEKRYTRAPNAMKAIGIIETLDYIDGRLTLMELTEKISANTARLAKRQSTFNRSQFRNTVAMDLRSLEEKIREDIKLF